MRVAWKECAAELIGTFALCFIGAGAICTDALTKGGVGLIGIAMAHGLVLSIAVSCTMAISGGQLNPAVTFALWATGRIKDPAQVAQLVVSQLVGAVLAGLCLTSQNPKLACSARFDRIGVGDALAPTGPASVQALVRDGASLLVWDAVPRASGYHVYRRANTNNHNAYTLYNHTPVLDERASYCMLDTLDTYFVFLRTRVLTGELSLQEEQELVAWAKAWIASRVTDLPALQQYLDNWGDWQPWP